VTRSKPNNLGKTCDLGLESGLKTLIMTKVMSLRRKQIEKNIDFKKRENN
jgi:hypothetical protein